MFLDYECMKATTTHNDKDIVAWFAPQIPMQVGPRKYGHLPGAILMLSEEDGKVEIMATKVTLDEQSEEVKKPTKGKKVTSEEYEKVIEDKMKELNSNSKGNNIFTIRG